MAGLRLGSLCTGYGGLDLAVEQVLPIEQVGLVADIAPAANQVLAARFPQVPNLGDIRHVDWDQVEPVDVLTAGYPCQPFSLAGYRKGEDDPRHLWPQVLRAVRALRPGLVVLENVRGHLSKGFDRVLGDLAQAGYDARWCCLSAADVGAPHTRLRLFCLAWPAAAHPAGLGLQRRRDPRDLVRPPSPARQTQPEPAAPIRHDPRHVFGGRRLPAGPQPGAHSPAQWWVDPDGRDYRQAIAQAQAALSHLLDMEETTGTGDTGGAEAA